jgi:hypothetical protein
MEVELASCGNPDHFQDPVHSHGRGKLQNTGGIL